MKKEWTIPIRRTSMAYLTVEAPSLLKALKIADRQKITEDDIENSSEDYDIDLLAELNGVSFNKAQAAVDKMGEDFASEQFNKRLKAEKK